MEYKRNERRPDPSPQEISAECERLQRQWDFVELFRRSLPVALKPYRTWGLIVQMPTRREAMTLLRERGQRLRPEDACLTKESY